MTSSLSNLVDNFSEGIHKIKCKYNHDNEKFEECRTKYKHCKCNLEYVNVKDDRIVYKLFCCNKYY